MADYTIDKFSYSNNTYNLEDNTETRSDHRHYEDDLVPIYSKTYTSGYYATAADQETSTFYWMSIRPDDWNKPWKVHFKTYTWVPGQSAYHSLTYTLLTGRKNDFSYSDFNEVTTTAHYYITVMPLKSAGYTAGYGHAVAMSMRYASNYTNSSYKRNFQVDVYSVENCTVTLLDEPVLQENWTGYSSTNYENVSNLNAASRGLQETGDANDVNYYHRLYSNRFITSAALYRYQLVFTQDDTTVVPMNSVNNSIATTKTLTTASFDPFGPIYYYASTTTYSANTRIASDATLYDQNRFDLRYATNVGTTLTQWSPVYLVMQMNDDGRTAKLHSSPITQTLPSTEDGLLYRLLGIAYSNYQLEMFLDKPVYQYKNGSIQQVTVPSADKDVFIVNIDMNSDDTINSVDKTIAEIEAAAASKAVIARVFYSDSDYTSYNYYLLNYVEPSYCLFSYVSASFAYTATTAAFLREVSTANIYGYRNDSDTADIWNFSRESGTTKPLLYAATCSTAASTAAKTATLLTNSTGYSLSAGVKVAVTFQYGNSATTPTLNINDGGAKDIVVPTAVATVTSGNGTTYNTWGPYETIIFTYNGSQWVSSGSARSIYNAYALANSKGSGTITGVSANGTSVATSGVANIPAASTSAYGVTKLSSSTSSTSTSLAATASAVKAAYDHGGVTSVNGETGAVTFSIPTKVSDLTNDSGFITDAGVTSFNGSTGAITYTAPVTSVNGDTGAVTITVPTKTSDLTNDSGFITGYTDNKVLQSAVITTNGAYPLILGYSTATTAVTNSVNKSSTLTYNPSTKALVTGGTVDGYDLNAASAKAVDTSIAEESSSANLPTSAAVAAFVEGKGYVTTDTTYSAGTGLDLDGTTINHSNSITAGTVGSTSATSGASLTIPYLTYDSEGHITATGTKTHTVNGFAASSHSHGNISSAGDITATATIASGDRLVINDESAGLIINSSITFGSDTTTYLRNDGTWGTPSSGAAIYSGTSTPSSSLGNDGDLYILVDGTSSGSLVYSVTTT